MIVLKMQHHQKLIRVASETALGFHEGVKFNHESGVQKRFIQKKVTIELLKENRKAQLAKPKMKVQDIEGKSHHELFYIVKI